MILGRFNPWTEMFSTQGQAEQFFSDAFGSAVTSERTVQTLPLDIRQSDEAFHIEASVPGFKPEDVEITLDENVLTIRGIRHPRDETRLGTYVQRERTVSSVHRHVYLPAQVKAGEITAGFDNGILTITVPREQKAQPKRIPVSVTHGAEQGRLIESSGAVASATV